MIDSFATSTSVTGAEEAFVVDVQSFLHQLMIDRGFSRSQLADAMGVSRARISQLFSDECRNFTIRLLARAVHALGERVELRTAKSGQDEFDCESFASDISLGPIEFKSARSWDMGVANDDDVAFDCLQPERPDPRLPAALTDHARRTRGADRMVAYA